MAATPLATIGILSVGDMGVGIARLLIAKGFSVATNCEGRSQDTVARAKAAKVSILPTDTALVQASDVILSVVPPRDAAATAQRVIDAIGAGPATSARSAPLYFADMNAVAPSTAKLLAGMFAAADAPVRFLDGCIMGGPPAPKQQPAGEGSTSPSASEWSVPLMPTSGPHRLADLPFGAELSAVLRSRHISDDVGAASGLKMCFASLSKGYAAIAIQAFTTAQRLGVLHELQGALADLAPGRVKATEGALTGMAPKAYRWVREMEEISRTHVEEGGFEPEIFAGAAEVFRAVAEDTVLGLEKVGDRKRGRTAEDVAVAMAEGLEKKRRKQE
ncbi:6-phosphogluconate dehydrogenase [Pleurostoma richardsiae]|uniref:6-phosphogluconate dehydrogenase n=1 Tax=Pleurostoma richardsiae TaxID=41990 RepID=A0AA38S821_9PEZI|nr:6-phosphogluconate dehydrogenase [Pleurostoma richardsiae]